MSCVKSIIPIDSTGANETLYADVSATPGTTHSYCVIAFSDGGGRSAGVCDDGTQSVVLAPYDLAAADGVKEDRVDVTWESNSTTAVMFNIFRDGTFIKSVSRDARSHDDYGSTAGQVYEYSVVAVTAMGDESVAVADSGSRKLRAPAAVAASDEEYEDKVVVTWADNSAYEDGYIITREDTAAAVVDSVWTLGPNRRSYTDFTAVPAVTYRYDIVAFDTKGEAQGESESAGDEGRRILLAPTNVQATDGEYEDRVEIIWDDNSDAEDGCRVYRDGALIDSVPDNFTSYVDASPLFGDTCEYSVAAYDALTSGESALASDSGSTTILPPASFNASDSYLDRNEVELTWVDVSQVEEGYEILRDGVPIATTGANTTTFTDTPPPYGDRSYTYCIRAFRGDVTSATVCDAGVCGVTDLARLLADDGGVGDKFGYSVAISGNWAIIGAPYDDENGTDAGAAYVFARDAEGTWSQRQKLLADLGDAYDFFGTSVSVGDDRAFIGAPGDDPKGSESGSVYVFGRSGSNWIQQDNLFPGDGAAGDHFGHSVAFYASEAFGFVGAWGDDDKGPESGSVYAFLDSSGTWCPRKAVPADGAAGDRFGWSVAFSGDGFVIVGAYGDDCSAANSGSVYVYRITIDISPYPYPTIVWGLALHNHLYPVDGDVDDNFGYSVAASGKMLVAGTPRDDDNGSLSGSAYVFERQSVDPKAYIEKQKLYAGDAAAGDNFGHSVAMDADAVVVGAYGDDDWGAKSGSAYVYELDGSSWVQESKILAPDGTADDKFGYSVGVSGGVPIIGAPYRGDSTGAAYTYLGETAPPQLPPEAAVFASDGTFTTRVRVTWEDTYTGEDGFHVYRDSVLIDSTGPNMESYDDTEAQPGRTYEYCVAPYDGGVELAYGCDFGWRPPNGNITGQISTPMGAGVEAISVGLSPEPTRALLLDGAGGHVRIPDDENELYFTASQSFTMEMWIKYNDHSLVNRSIIATRRDSKTRFDICTRGGVEGVFRPGQLYLGLFGPDGGMIRTTSTVTDLNDDQWHHVAVVRDGAADLLTLYIDGADATGTVERQTPVGELSGSSEVFLGGFGEISVRTWFGGQLDEVRIWNVARGEDAIKAAMRQQLRGDEAGLLAYWPLDEGAGLAITDLTKNAHYGTLEDGVYWTDNTAPLDITATTDVEGNYVLDGIRYGERTTFEVRPFEGVRQFLPVFKTITLSTGHPVENQVNFVETTSLTVSGSITFAGTGCPVPNVKIHVDGQFRGTTDTKGKFAVTTSNGKYWIRPEATNHDFDPDSVFLDIQDDIDAVDFTDATKRTLSGRVGGGGCLYPIGDVTITFRSENHCMEDSHTVQTAYNTTYSIDLPPQKYLVTAEVESVPAGLATTEVMKFFERLGPREVDLTDSNAVLDFIYRAPLKVTITGLEGFIPAGCTQLSYNGELLPDSLPVIEQLTVLPLAIQVNEDYGNENLCPLDNGAVMIYDEIFDIEDSVIVLVVRDGEAEYTTVATTPSLAAGRVDSEGNNRSFQKAIKATVYAEGSKPVTASEWVLVTGHVAPPGSDFVTAKATELQYILRDPPGDNSYSYLEKGFSTRTTYQYSNVLRSGAVGPKINLLYGWGQDTWVGFGFGLLSEISYQAGVETESLFGGINHTESTSVATLTTRTRFSTSADELFIGEQGDVFIGTGMNFLFGKVRVVEVENCNVTAFDAVAFEPGEIGTIFTYTQQYIHDVLIPELDSLAAYCKRQDDPRGGTYENGARQWRDWLKENDSLKAAARLEDPDPVNRSFSAGAEFSYFMESDTTGSYWHEERFTFDFEGGPQFHTMFEAFGGALDLLIQMKAKAHHEEVTDCAIREQERSSAVGYVLSDINLGDHFTVDVMHDSKYPSPVFDVLGGVSSCPYEPWPDAEGEPRMLARDKVELSMITDQADLVDLPPDKPAVINLTIANLSPTHDTRIYELREVPTSNPYGAVIKGNGVWLYEGLIYYINGDPANNSQLVTLTVERGPTRYNYKKLAVMVYPQCEWNIWERRTGGPLMLSDTLFFDLSFDAACSDIKLYLPLSGWTFNKADQVANDSLIVWLTDYELEISEDAPVDAVGVEYRRLGTGNEGPGEWRDIRRVTGDSINPVETWIAWYPPPDAADGVYELRAFTVCGSGRGVSTISAGTIDRHAPQVFGTPEPADRELSFGEDISITFNEPIDRESVDLDSITLRYLDGPLAGAEIPIETVCDGRTIIIAPTVTPRDLEGRQLEARVAGVSDLACNPMEAAKVWNFYVRQSVFTWAKTNIVADVAFRAPGSISAKLVNGGDSTAIYTIDAESLPVWITEASPASGSLPPGGTAVISFAIKEDIAMGPYAGRRILATSDRGDTRLDIFLVVSCHEPVWSFDPRKYEHTMTIVTQVKIGGAISADPEDRIAALVGNQIRGVAHVEPGPSSNVAYLTVYSNRSSGETVRFQVWDADSCKLYNTTLEHFAFTANGMIGNPANPVMLTALDQPPTTAQVIPVREGWNWFSVNAQAVDMSVDGVLSFLTPATGDLIKSQTAFAEFDPLLGWVGTLQLLNNTSSYMVRLSEEGEIYVEGADVDPLTTSIPIYQGWNWIGYTPTCTTEVTPALAGLGSTPSGGDVIRSQTAFAQFVAKDGWYGNLDTMEPGKGYKLYLVKVGGAMTGFTYPGCAGGAATLIARAPGEDPLPKTEIDAGIPGWTLDRNEYQYSMTVTAVLTLDGDEWRDENGMIGAFVDGECRGLAQPIHLSGINRYVAFLMVHSNEIAGEKVVFKAYDPGKRAVYNIAERLAYEADASVGSVREPLLLTTEGIDFELADAVPGAYSLSQNYPNPFNPSTIITFSLKDPVHTRVEVFNILGQSVKILADQPYAAGRHQLVWNGTDAQEQPVASGVYFYRIVAGDIIDTKKMVLLK